MEFPDDVLVIIRDYSRPRMKFVNEYYAGVRKTRYDLHMIQYFKHDVKRMLYSEDAPKAIVAWTDYTNAVQSTDRIRFTPLFDKTGKIDRVRCQELKRRDEIQKQKKDMLCVVLYDK